MRGKHTSKIIKKKNSKKKLSPIEILAKSILKITLKETKKRLDIWIDENLDRKLNLYIADQIETEFSESVLPILLKKIDIHVKQAFQFNQKQVVDTLVKVAQKFINDQKKG